MISNYKAWHKKSKEMLRVVSINFDEKFIRGLSEVERNMDIESSYNFDEIEFLQSTGLFDKNGKEIFEGHIIDKGYSNLEIEEKIGYVQLDVAADSTGYLHEQWLGWITNNGDSLLDVCEHCTVIGNIYENEDLIK